MLKPVTAALAVFLCLNGPVMAASVCLVGNIKDVFDTLKKKAGEAPVMLGEISMGENDPSQPMTIVANAKTGEGFVTFTDRGRVCLLAAPKHIEVVGGGK